MRVLQILAGAERGGAENFFERLVCALSRKGLDQHVICRPFPDRLKTFKEHHLPVTPLSFYRVLDWYTRWAIQKTIDAYKPDIVMTWMSRASHLCPKGRFVFVGRLGGYYNLKYYQKADFLIGITPDLQNYLIREGWPSHRTACVTNFVPEPSRTPPQDRSVYATPEDAPLLLSLGRYHQNKGFDVLISALSYLPQAYVWVVGQGEEEKALRALAHQKGVAERVRFIPWQKDITAFYKAADIYVCPSRIEPLGSVVLEAWAHGIPLVAAESSGPKSLVQDHENGLLVPIDQEEALAYALQEVLASSSLRKKLSTQGRNSYLANHTEEKVCQQYLDFFNQIL